MTDPTQYARWFRDSTPYISTHRHKTFVILLGGDAIVHDNITHIVHDLALLSVLGVRVVLVHGARPQIDAAVAAAGLTPHFHDHRRITDQPTIVQVESAVARVRVRIEGLFSMGLPNTPLHNTKIHVLSGNLVTARPFGVVDGIDHLFTGRVRRIHSERIHQMLNEHCIVLLSPLGYSPSGEAFNLSSEELATDVAIALGADKLITFDSASAVTDADGTPLSDLSPSELDSLLDTATLDDTTRLRLTELLRACRAGVPRTHLIGFGDDGALLQELYTAAGCGTQISEDGFQHIRRATAEDVAGIVELDPPARERRRIGATAARPARTRDRPVFRCGARRQHHRLLCVVSVRGRALRRTRVPRHAPELSARREGARRRAGPQDRNRSAQARARSAVPADDANARLVQRAGFRRRDGRRTPGAAQSGVQLPTQLGRDAETARENDLTRGTEVTRMATDKRRHSSRVVDGLTNAPARAMLYAVGFTDADFSKPQVGIASTWSTVTPCNMHIDKLALEAAKGAGEAGGKAIVFNTITISDGISMGTEGMKYSLVSREVIADSIETVVGAKASTVSWPSAVATRTCRAARWPWRA